MKIQENAVSRCCKFKKKINKKSIASIIEFYCI